MKSLFINLHGDTNMTAAYLHSLIDKAGFDITTVHFRRYLAEVNKPTQTELIILRKVVKKINPEVIMISVNSITFWTAVEVSKLFPTKKIIWGGVQPLIDPESCLKHVNIIIRGEGDEAIIDLLNALQNNKSYDKIKNVWVKKKGKIIKNDFRPLIKDLDALPFPDYSDHNKLYILGNKIYKKNPIPHIKYSYNISFSRGCPFSCTFCINHFYNKIFNYKYLRRRSVDSAIKELLLAKKNSPKIKSIGFWDDIFMNDPKWLKEFAYKYKKYINLPFFAYGNANFITEENMKLLKKAGIHFFELGLQTGSEHIRKNIFKRMDTDEKILKADQIIHKYKIPVGYDLIFSEFENEEDLKNGLKFLLKLKKPFKIGRHKLVYYPNFEITNMALKEGLITLDSVASINPDVKTQEITKKNVEKNAAMNYHYLIGKRYIPNRLILYIFNSKWHKKYPHLLTEMASFINKMENLNYSIKSVFSLLLDGEFKYVYHRLLNKKEFMPS